MLGRSSRRIRRRGLEDRVEREDEEEGVKEEEAGEGEESTKSRDGAIPARERKDVKRFTILSPSVRRSTSQ